MGLRLMIYDRTCPRPWILPGLSQIWGAGRHLYRALGRLDASRGAASWAEALDWLGSVQPGAASRRSSSGATAAGGWPASASEALDARALQPRHPHHDRLARVRDRLLPDGEALWWFRTCETFGTETGQAFARAWTRFHGCRAAGHTYVIGAWQSGLHSLRPGETPAWSPGEGVQRGPRPAASPPAPAPPTQSPSSTAASRKASSRSRDEVTFGSGPLCAPADDRAWHHVATREAGPAASRMTRDPPSILDQAFSFVPVSPRSSPHLPRACMLHHTPPHVSRWLTSTLSGRCAQRAEPERHFMHGPLRRHGVGGARGGAAPLRLGSGPMAKVSSPPFTMSAWRR